MKDVILTGVRSNDEPTLGNYLGAFIPMVRLQREKAGEYQLNMFVPDLHSFTTPIDHETLYARTLKNLKYFVAAGLDIDNADTYIYRQSYISAHSELTWILDCFTYMGEMSRMTQFKEKTSVNEDEHAAMVNGIAKAIFSELKDNKTVFDEENFRKVVKNSYDDTKKLVEAKKSAHASVGIFNYPVLMAADILLYNARYVPVGDDQKQHLEITRDIAMRMNNKFVELFTVPEDWKHQLSFASLDNGVRVRSLSNPEKKMSKSVSDPRGTILLSDNPADAAKKILSATTDSIGAIHYDWDAQPGITNLLQILALLTDTDQAQVVTEWENKSSYGELKQAVADAVSKFLTEFQVRFDNVGETALLAKLTASEEIMRMRANETLHQVQLAIGLRPRK